MKLTKGIQRSVLQRTDSVAGSADTLVETLTDSLLVSVFAEVLTGTLDIEVYGITNGGPGDSTPAQELRLIRFPTLTSPSSELLIQTAAAVTQRLRFKASWTGSVKFDVQARAIDGGTSKSQIITASTARVNQQTINTGPAQIIIPASLVDGLGFMCRNWSSNGAIIYVAEDPLKAVPSVGWPLAPGDSFDISVKGGQAWFASSSINGADLRIIEGDQ